MTGIFCVGPGPSLFRCKQAPAIHSSAYLCFGAGLQSPFLSRIPVLCLVQVLFMSGLAVACAIALSLLLQSFAIRYDMLEKCVYIGSYSPGQVPLTLEWTYNDTYLHGRLISSAVRSGWPLKDGFMGSAVSHVVVFMLLVLCRVAWCGVEWCGVEWCGVVWCGVFCSVVLCCVVLCCVVLCYGVLLCCVLLCCCVVLCCVVLCCVVLCCVALRCVALRCVVLCCIVLCCIGGALARWARAGHLF